MQVPEHAVDHDEQHVDLGGCMRGHAITRRPRHEVDVEILGGQPHSTPLPAPDRRSSGRPASIVTA